jgi:hypothetical protein
MLTITIDVSKMPIIPLVIAVQDAGCLMVKNPDNALCIMTVAADDPIAFYKLGIIIAGYAIAGNTLDRMLSQNNSAEQKRVPIYTFNGVPIPFAGKLYYRDIHTLLFYTRSEDGKDFSECGSNTKLRQDLEAIWQQWGEKSE